MKSIRIYSLLCIALSSCFFSAEPPTNTSPISFQETSFNIAAVGDSLTAGYGLRNEESYPFILEQILREEGYNIRVTNAGSSGQTSGGLFSAKEWILLQKPNIIILCIGGNDMLRGIDVDVTASFIQQTIAFYQSNNIQVVLAGIEPFESLGDLQKKAYTTMFEDIAKTFDIPLIPLLWEGIEYTDQYIQPDGIHPTAMGTKVIANNVASYLRALLQKK